MKLKPKGLKVRHRMSRDFATVAPDDPLQKVVELLRRRDIRSVPVVDNGTLIGIVTDRDVRSVVPAYPFFRDEKEIRHYSEHLKVTAAMTADPLRVDADAPLMEAAKLLETYKIGALPVVSGNRLVGMISVTDMLKVFIEQNEVQKQ